VPFSDAPTGDVAEPTELLQAETLENATATCADLLTTNEVSTPEFAKFQNTNLVTRAKG